MQSKGTGTNVPRPPPRRLANLRFARDDEGDVSQMTEPDVTVGKVNSEV
ncbi:MAG: hypothetical protein AAFQ23_01380 [Cyanobacteria bacterium J06623_1]